MRDHYYLDTDGRIQVTYIQSALHIKWREINALKSMLKSSQWEMLKLQTIHYTSPLSWESQ